VAKQVYGSKHDRVLNATMPLAWNTNAGPLNAGPTPVVDGDPRSSLAGAFRDGENEDGLLVSFGLGWVDAEHPIFFSARGHQLRGHTRSSGVERGTWVGGVNT
jgi:hypothetical protein